jgi:hypothetical protein
MLDGTPDPNSPIDIVDGKTAASIAASMAKGILYICLTVCICLGLSNCSLDSETVAKCETACAGSNGIREVSIYSCRCNDPDPGNSSIYISP